MAPASVGTIVESSRPSPPPSSSPGSSSSSGKARLSSHPPHHSLRSRKQQQTTTTTTTTTSREISSAVQPTNGTASTDEEEEEEEEEEQEKEEEEEQKRKQEEQEERKKRQQHGRKEERKKEERKEDERQMEEEDKEDDDRSPNPVLESLFDLTYLRHPISPLQWLCLLLYVPLGVVIALVRVLLTAMLCLVANATEWYSPWKMSDRLVFRMICWIAGVFISDIDGELPGEQEMAHSFVVSNHTMTGDPGVLWFLYHRNAKVVHKANVGSFDIITRHKIHVGGNKQEVKDAILHDINKDTTPVVIYPEGATTNGRVGLLRYSAFIFGLGHPVVPVATRLNPAFPFIPFHTVRPWYTFHMFLVAFQPYVLVEAKVLGVQTRRADETAEQFADRVQRMTAKAMGLAATTYTIQDKSDLRKKHHY